MGEGVLGNTAKEGARAWGLGSPSPHFPFLAREWECLRGSAGRELEGAGALGVQTPRCSQAPTSQDYSEQWGRRDGESLNWREGNRQIRRPGGRRPKGNWEGVRVLLPAQVCAGRGATGFPGEAGKPSQLDSGFPLLLG